MAKKNDFTHRKPETFLQQPKYPGGHKALDAFIKENLRYPEEAIKNKIEGTVAVLFDIDIFGEVHDPHVKHKIGYGCDEEAIRLVKLLKFEKKRYKGMRVTFHRTLNIHFRIHEASKPPAPGQTIKYNYVEENKQKVNPTTYSIKLPDNKTK